MIPQITEMIFSCETLESLREVEDFVLGNRDIYDKVQIKVIYNMLEVRNKYLYEEKLVDKIIYKDT